MSLHAFCEIAERVGEFGGVRIQECVGLGAVHNMKPQQTT